MARTLFGVSDSSHYLNPLILESLNDTPLSNKQEQAIAASILSDPTLADLFRPVQDIYYDGPMGGYGENLKARCVGYSVSTPESVCRALALRQMNVPMICTSDEFKQFIRNTPMMTRAVALVMHEQVMCKPKQRHVLFDEDDSFEPIYYAVVFEKRPHLDTLFVYNSSIAIIELDHVKSYFRSTFRLLTPDKVRKRLNGVSGLYAIQDVKQLLSVLNNDLNNDVLPENVHADSPIFSNITEQCFHLSSSFLYNEKSLMKEHVTSLLEMQETFSPSKISPICQIS